MVDQVWASTLGAGKYISLYNQSNISHYITSQLSLAIPAWVGAMSTSQTAVMLCGWGVTAGMVRMWMAGKTAVTGRI